jgi:anti-anti-sigma regulatory factor
MATVAEWIKISNEHLARDLQTAREKLEIANGELVLDWASVSRMGADSLAAIATLADTADEKSVRLIFRGVNIDIYRVLKLSNLSGRITFLP